MGSLVPEMEQVRVDESLVEGIGFALRAGEPVSRIRIRERRAHLSCQRAGEAERMTMLGRELRAWVLMTGGVVPMTVEVEDLGRISPVEMAIRPRQRTVVAAMHFLVRSGELLVF